MPAATVKSPPINEAPPSDVVPMTSTLPTFTSTSTAEPEVPFVAPVLKFPERLKRISDVTTTLLDRPLPQKAIEIRRQGNRELSYITSHYAIRAANEVFGYGGWSTKILSTTRTQFNAGGKEQMFFETYVRVTVHLDNGEDREFEDVGTGTAASLVDWELDKAAKGAVSDAEKRALRHWGDQFGLSLYDKDTNQDYAGQVQQHQNIQQQPQHTQAAAAPVPLRPQPPQGRPAPSNDAENDPGRNTIPCMEEGCDGFVSGFKPSTGNYLPVARMAELSQQKCGGLYCSTHYQARLPRRA